jgi:glycosyltransferase involved in cell wall biosynthesis
VVEAPITEKFTVKKIIIVSPHFPPSNLAAVHRTRLFAQHLPSLGWEPIIVTVHHRFYEEELDWNLHSLLPSTLRVERVNALPSKPVRTIGDIGVRGFYSMYKKIMEIVKEEKVDFLYIPIPSNFAALLGRLVYRKTKVPYGIDYIDPWVHRWPGTEKRFSKHWWSMKLGEWLEPFAVKKVALITGVAQGYFDAVLERNSHLKTTAITAAMPYGGEALDHDYVKKNSGGAYLFEKVTGKIDLVYAGAMLPKAIGPLNEVLKSIAANRKLFENVRFHFIGSGKSPSDENGYNIKALAEEYNLWGSVILEYPKRIPYLDVLSHLAKADGAFILGSTEPHYTPSKVYQSVLSGKPIFAVLHEKSTACDIIRSTNAGVTLSFNGEDGLGDIRKNFVSQWQQYTTFSSCFDASTVDREKFEEYSAFSVTKILAGAISAALEQHSQHRVVAS